MSKKKSTRKNRVINQKGNLHWKRGQLPKTNICIGALIYLILQLINLFIEACFEEQINQLKIWVINGIMDIFC